MAASSTAYSTPSSHGAPSIDLTMGYRPSSASPPFDDLTAFLNGHSSASGSEDPLVPSSMWMDPTTTAHPKGTSPSDSSSASSNEANHSFLNGHGAMGGVVGRGGFLTSSPGGEDAGVKKTDGSGASSPHLHPHRPHHPHQHPQPQTQTPTMGGDFTFTAPFTTGSSTPYAMYHQGDVAKPTEIGGVGAPHAMVPNQHPASQPFVNGHPASSGYLQHPIPQQQHSFSSFAHSQPPSSTTYPFSTHTASAPASSSASSISHAPVPPIANGNVHVNGRNSGHSRSPPSFHNGPLNGVGAPSDKGDGNSPPSLSAFPWPPGMIPPSSVAGAGGVGGMEGEKLRLVNRARPDTSVPATAFLARGVGGVGEAHGGAGVGAGGLPFPPVSAMAGAGFGAGEYSGEGGHNVVEKRYRTRINDCIALLADLVPALAHLRALPSASTARRHSSQFIVSAASIGRIPEGLVDGVVAADKLSKGNILAKSVDYIRHLRRARDEMVTDVEELKSMIINFVENGNTLVAQWESSVRSKAAAREKIRFAEQQSASSGTSEQGGEDEENDGGAGDVDGVGVGGDGEEEGGTGKGKRKGPRAANGVGDGGAEKATKKRKATSSSDLGNKASKGKKSTLSPPTPVLTGPPSRPASFPVFTNTNPPPTHLSAPMLSPSNDNGVSADEATLAAMLAEFDPSQQATFMQHRSHPASNGGYSHQYPDIGPASYNAQSYAASNGVHWPVGNGMVSGANESFLGAGGGFGMMAHGVAPRRMLATFMGLTFAVGSGYDYARRASESEVENVVVGYASTAALLGGSMIKVGMQAVGWASFVILLAIVAKPSLLYDFVVPPPSRPAKPRDGDASSVASIASLTSTSSIITSSSSTATVDRPAIRRRLQSLSGLLPVDVSPSFSSSKPLKLRRNRIQQRRRDAALRAHAHWKQVGGAPNGALASAIGSVREAAVAVLRGARTSVGMRHGGGSDFVGKDSGRDKETVEATEDALLWMRIAEIETALGPSQTSVVGRLHTALRLYNLSQSTRWPSSNSTSPAQASFPRVNAVLSLHVRTLLGDSNSVSEMLWRRATQPTSQPDRKDSVTPETWLGEALSANFEEACSILGKGRTCFDVAEDDDDSSDDEDELATDVAGKKRKTFSSPSDTLPLFRIAEVRCEVALMELWSRMMVATVKRTCPLPPPERGVPSDVRLDSLEDLPTRVNEASDGFAVQVSAARAVVETAIDHIIATTLPGSPIRTLAAVTKGFWGLGFGRPHVSYACANALTREARDGGPAKRFACVEAFLELIMGRTKAAAALGKPEHRRRQPKTTVDKLATATLGWLTVRRRHFVTILLAEEACQRRKGHAPSKSSSSGQHIDPVDLETATVRLVQLLKDSALLEDEVVAASTKQTREAVQAGEAPEYNLRDAVADCIKAAEDVGRKALADHRPSDRVDEEEDGSFVVSVEEQDGGEDSPTLTVTSDEGR